MGEFDGRKSQNTLTHSPKLEVLNSTSAHSDARLTSAPSGRQPLCSRRSTNGDGLPRAVASPGEAALLQAGAIGQAEVPEAPLEVLIQEGVQHGVEAAVGVAQRDAEVPARHHQEVLVVDVHHGLDDDEDVDGSPADDEGRHDHQDHAGDPPQVPVLLFGAGQQAHALEAEDHQTVADGDDQHGNHKGKDEHEDFHHRVPVELRFGESECARSLS